MPEIDFLAFETGKLKFKDPHLLKKCLFIRIPDYILCCRWEKFAAPLTAFTAVGSQLLSSFFVPLACN